MENKRAFLKDKQRIVIKIGSSSLQHPETGDLDYTKLDVLVRELCNLRNMGKDVVLVTSGAISVGKKAVHITEIDGGRGSQHCGEAGVRRGRAGEADDDLSEDLCGIQSDDGADTDD